MGEGGMIVSSEGATSDSCGSVDFRGQESVGRGAEFLGISAPHPKRRLKQLAKLATADRTPVYKTGLEQRQMFDNLRKRKVVGPPGFEPLRMKMTKTVKNLFNSNNYLRFPLSRKSLEGPARSRKNRNGFGFFRFQNTLQSCLSLTEIKHRIVSLPTNQT
jgi:hypothetical protein